jgi:hypothetical protein
LQLTAISLDFWIAKERARFAHGWDRGDDDVGHFGVKLDLPMEPDEDDVEDAEEDEDDE